MNEPFCTQPIFATHDGEVIASRIDEDEPVFLMRPQLSADPEDWRRAADVANNIAQILEGR